MDGDVEKEYGRMTTLSASITHLHPSRLWIIRLAAKLVGCKIKAWKAKPRKKNEMEIVGGKVA